MSNPWPFAQWGLDIVGHFPKAIRNKMYLLVGTDYFTKWVEVEPWANIKDVDAKRFVWKNIVTRFGIRHTLISNNGFQLIARLSEGIAVTWALKIGTPPRLIHKGIDRPRLSIRL